MLELGRSGAHHHMVRVGTVVRPYEYTKVEVFVQALKRGRPKKNVSVESRRQFAGERSQQHRNTPPRTKRSTAGLSSASWLTVLSHPRRLPDIADVLRAPDHRASVRALHAVVPTTLRPDLVDPWRCPAVRGAEPRREKRAGLSAHLRNYKLFLCHHTVTTRPPPQPIASRFSGRVTSRNER